MSNLQFVCETSAARSNRHEIQRIFAICSNAMLRDKTSESTQIMVNGVWVACLELDIFALGMSFRRTFCNVCNKIILFQKMMRNGDFLQYSDFEIFLIERVVVGFAERLRNFTFSLQLRK